MWGWGQLKAPPQISADSVGADVDGLVTTTLTIPNTAGGEQARYCILSWNTLQSLYVLPFNTGDAEDLTAAPIIGEYVTPVVLDLAGRASLKVRHTGADASLVAVRLTPLENH